MKVELHEVQGFVSALCAMRLSFNSRSNSWEVIQSNGLHINKEDHALLLKLNDTTSEALR